MEFDPYVSKALAAGFTQKYLNLFVLNNVSTSKGVEVQINKTDLQRISRAMHQHLDPIVVSLSTPSDERTEFDLVPIVEFLKGCSFFKCFETENEREMLFFIAKNIELKEYDHEEVIYAEGDVGMLLRFQF